MKVEAIRPSYEKLALRCQGFFRLWSMIWSIFSSLNIKHENPKELVCLFASIV